jgi:hypothetical protein
VFVTQRMAAWGLHSALRALPCLSFLRTSAIMGGGARVGEGSYGVQVGLEFLLPLSRTEEGHARTCSMLFAARSRSASGHAFLLGARPDKNILNYKLKLCHAGTLFVCQP